MLSFERSADVLLILIIGGTGYLYGGIIGALIFRLLQNYLSELTARYWQFWIGLLLVAIVLVGRDRIGGGFSSIRTALTRLFRGAKPSAIPTRGPDHGALPGNAVLETRNLEKRFGGITAASGISIAIRKGARHALIGPNGAGKTTFVNLLTGVLRPSGGNILLDGAAITHLEPHQRVRLGIARTFQINQLFADLTPIESLGLAISERHGAGRDWWRRVGSKSAITDEIAELLERFGLTDVMAAHTATLPYGKQRLLEMALAFACRPRVLLLDEPAAGVPEAERHDILATIAALPTEYIVLLIEHDMDIVFSFADRIPVLVNGELFAEGAPEEVARDPRVKAVYLGEAFDG